MNKNYREINFDLGSTIEDAVNKLLNYKKQGLLVYGKFNGVTLYSDTVTMEKAYKNITGRTKGELDKKRKQWLENYEHEKESIKKIYQS